jgi:glycosyltransferase involved in cell wall biosynthesis
MPTFFGPTNIPPLEAMKLGCPVAVSNIYGMPEQTRGAALLFDPESEQEIANAIALLWENDALCYSLREQGKIVSAQWTSEHFSDKLESVLRSMLTDKVS